MRKLFFVLPLIIFISCSILKNTKTEDGNIIPNKENLVGNKWIWKESTLADKSKITLTNNKSFITFEENDKLGVGSDCNKGSAFYKLKNEVIEISPVMSTKMYCGKESTEKEFFNELKNAHNLYLKDNKLHINLKDSIGEMIFVKK